MAQLKDLLVSGAARLLNGLNINGDLTIAGNLLPATTNTYTIGDSTHQWLQTHTQLLSVGAGDISSTGYEAVISGDFHTTGDSLFDGKVGIGGTGSDKLYVAGPTTLGVASNGSNDRTTINGKLVVNPSYDTAANSYNEGIRVNLASNNWSEILLGGAIGSTNSVDSNTWLIGRRGQAGTYGAAGDLTIENGTSTGLGLTLHQGNAGGLLYAKVNTNIPVWQVINDNSFSGNNQYTWLGNYLAPNVGQGGNSIILIGQANNKANSGYIGFHFDTSGSVDKNYLTFGLYGCDQLVNLFGNGNLGVGTTSPEYKLDVNGNICVRTNSFLMGELSALYDSVDGYKQYTLEGTVTNHGADLELYTITINSAGTGSGTKAATITLKGTNGDAYFANTVGIAGTNSSYKLYVEGTTYLNGKTTISNSDAYAGAEVYGRIKVCGNSSNNRVPITSGLTGDTSYGSADKYGTIIYSNGISMRDPYNNTSNNDCGFIRHVETTANSGYLEIGTGDNATEPIYIRQYNTSSTIAGEITLMDSTHNQAFNTTYPRTTNSYDLGTTSLYWRNAYITTTHGSLDGSADMVDNYHASQLWRSDGATWNPGADVSLNASANSQEWSFDIRRNGYTGCYWHVGDSALSTMLGVYADTGTVSVPYYLGVGGTSTSYKFYVNGNSGSQGHIIPTTTSTYDLGDTAHYWRAIYVNTINGYLSGTAEKATNADNADKLDGYHRAGLYTSPGAWINANGYTKTVTVTGDADTYYPVVISTTAEKAITNYISVWKNLGSTTNSTYSGNHSNGTSSMWLIYEVRNWYWDGNGGFVKCWYKSMPYATLCAKAEKAGSGVGALVVYLRGGTTTYNISTTYGGTATVYYETTNIGSSSYPVNVTPVTTIGNGGILTDVYLGYGDISGNASSATNVNIADDTSSKLYVLGATTTGNTRIYRESSVYMSGNVLYGAAWNDYAEFRSSHDNKPGRCVCENGDGTLSYSKERLQPGCNIVSDTFGFSIGETEKAKTPLAIAGRALAYPNEDRYSYKPGDPVCSGPNGTISKMTREEVREYPERIVGTVSEIPEYFTWGTGNVKVDGRIWIKVR